MTQATIPTTSIIIETDNLRAAAAARFRSLLTELARQLVDTPGRFELVVAYDPSQSDRASLFAALDDSGVQTLGRVDVRVLETQGLRYYEMKNAGAQISIGDLLVFLDSDVQPEAGWLSQLLDGFKDPHIDVIASQAYIGPVSSWIEKAVALFWFFPLRSGDGPREHAGGFFANSIAMRAEVFRRFPFPQDERNRGQCGSLARTLMASGIKIWRDPKARVMHPPLHDVQTVLQRGLLRGRDSRIDCRLRNQRYPLLRASRGLVLDLQDGIRRITSDYRSVGLAPASIPAVTLLAFGYHILTWMGFAIESFAPGWLGQRMRHAL